MKIKQKLSKIQQQLNVPKNQYNSFGNYEYRSCENIIEAVKPICKQHKTLLTITDSLVYVGDRYYIESTALLQCLEEDTSIKCVALARESELKKGMDSAQITGSTSSYARKYALNGLFCIDDTKDSDTQNNNETQSVKKTVDKNKLINEAHKLFRQINNPIDKMKVWIDQVKIHTESDLINGIKTMEKIIKEQK